MESVRYYTEVKGNDIIQKWKTGFEVGLKTIDLKSKMEKLGTEAERTLNLMVGIWGSSLQIAPIFQEIRKTVIRWEGREWEGGTSFTRRGGDVSWVFQRLEDKIDKDM